MNASCSHRDNALHFVIKWRDISDVKALIDAGVDVNKAGDLGYPPLHVACLQGDSQMVKRLVDRDADLFALSEDDAPFATRLAGHDNICDLLGP